MKSIDCQRVRKLASLCAHKARTLVAVACASFAVSAFAEDSLDVYGRLNAAAERVGGTAQAEATSDRFSNYRSVVGFRGSLALDHQLAAIFQVEGGIAVDTGVGSISNRDTRLGLTGPFGTVFGGQWTLPYTLATSAFDPFYPTTAGYMAIMGNGSASTTDNVMDRSSFDRRQQNVVQYWTPNLWPVSARLAYGFGESVVAATGAKPSLGSGSVTYEAGNLVISAAAEVHRHYQTATTSDKAAKIGAAYQWRGVRTSAVFEHLEYDTATGKLTRNAEYFSAIYKLADFRFLAGVSKAEDGHGAATGPVGFFRSGSATSAVQMTTGAEYALGERASVFVFYSRINNASAGTYDFAINPVGVQPGNDPHLLSIGLRLSFCGAILGERKPC